MEIGSLEYMNKLNEIYTFPENIIFVIAREADGKTSLLSARVEEGRPIGELPMIEGTKGSAVVGVKHIANADEFVRVTKDFRKVWDIDSKADFTPREEL